MWNVGFGIWIFIRHLSFNIRHSRLVTLSRPPLTPVSTPPPSRCTYTCTNPPPPSARANATYPSKSQSPPPTHIPRHPQTASMYSPSRSPSLLPSQTSAPPPDRL